MLRKTKYIESGNAKVAACPCCDGDGRAVHDRSSQWDGTKERATWHCRNCGLHSPRRTRRGARLPRGLAFDEHGALIIKENE